MACVAWLLGMFVAVTAGIVVALVTWDAWLFFVVALGGIIIGLPAAFVGMEVSGAIDVASRSRGRNMLAEVILVGTPAAVSIGIAVLVLAFA